MFCKCINHSVPNVRVNQRNHKMQRKNDEPHRFSRVAIYTHSRHFTILAKVTKTPPLLRNITHNNLHNEASPNTDIYAPHFPFKSPFNPPLKPPLPNLYPKLTATAANKPIHRSVGPHLSWYTTALRCLIILTRHRYNAALYMRAIQAMIVKAHAAAKESESPKLSKVAAIEPMRMENSSQERKVRSVAS